MLDAIFKRLKRHF